MRTFREIGIERDSKEILSFARLDRQQLKKEQKRNLRTDSLEKSVEIE